MGVFNNLFVQQIWIFVLYKAWMRNLSPVSTKKKKLHCFMRSYTKPTIIFVIKFFFFYKVQFAYLKYNKYFVLRLQLILSKTRSKNEYQLDESDWIYSLLFLFGKHRYCSYLIRTVSHESAVYFYVFQFGIHFLYPADRLCTGGQQADKCRFARRGLKVEQKCWQKKKKTSRLHNG